MEVLAIRFTRGDHATQPGGIILRKRGDDDFVTHSFNRKYGSKVPTEYYWGHYISDEESAREDFNERVRRSKYWDTGGSLIPEYALDEELKKELLDHERA